MASQRPPRRRDRHGRGVRGPLAPPAVPLARTRAERFDDVVLDAVDRLDDRWHDELSAVEFAVEDVPPPLAGAAPGDRPVPLGRLTPPRGERPAVIVVYRRPIEARATDGEELGNLVYDVVVEEFARLLGIDPDMVDPAYGDD